MKMDWFRCEIHNTLCRESVGCILCMKEKRDGMDAGKLGKLRGERLEDTEGVEVDG